jgi:hypothetical protein
MEDDGELTQDQLDLLDELEPGEAKGNVTLKDALDWDNDHFFRVRNELIDLGFVQKGRGRGGSTARITQDRDLEDLDEDEDDQSIALIRVTESELYEPMRNVLEEDWALDQGFRNPIVEITAQQGARSTGGQWSRPDITVVAIQTFEMLPTKHLDVVTFEIKPADGWNITSVFETAAHSKAATHSYLAIYTPEGKFPETDETVRILDECGRFNIGLVTFDDPSDYFSYNFIKVAPRLEPEPGDLDQFLRIQISTAGQAEIRKQTR